MNKKFMVYGEDNFKKHIIDAEEVLAHGTILTSWEDDYIVIKTIQYCGNIYYYQLDNWKKTIDKFEKIGFAL